MAAKRMHSQVTRSTLLPKQDNKYIYVYIARIAYMQM